MTSPIIFWLSAVLKHMNISYFQAYFRQLSLASEALPQAATGAVPWTLLGWGTSVPRLPVIR